MRNIQAGSELVECAAHVLAEGLNTRLRSQPRVSFAVSGGRTPWPVLRRLAESAIDWSRVDIYQVDERAAPAAAAARNLSGLRQSLLDRVAAMAHPMPVEGTDLNSAAARYASELPDRLDVVHLGLGDDGHTASLVPGDPVLDVTDRLVAITRPYRGHRRMTLTFPALNAARAIVWIVSSAGKVEMLQRLRNGDATIPAGRVSQHNAILITDEVEDLCTKESP